RCPRRRGGPGRLRRPWERRRWRRRARPRLRARPVASNAAPGCQAHAGELPLRVLLHGVAHTLAAVTAAAHPAEGIVVEAKAAPFVDPDRPRVEGVRHLEGGVEAVREAGGLEAELG